MILLDLFLAFLQVGAFSVGGGYVAIPLIQSIAVDGYAWLTAAEFGNLVTIAEMTPGPIVINAATFVGQRMAGLPGAIVASLASIIPSLILTTLLSWVYARSRSGQTMQTILQLLRAVVVSLIASAALKLLASAAMLNGVVFWPGLVIFCGAMLLLRFKKGGPIQIMALCGVVGAVLHIFHLA